MAEDKVETKDGAGSSDLANSFKTDNVFLFVPNLIGYSRVVLALLSFWFMPSNCYAAGFCYLLSGLLDAVDGHAARLLNQSSQFGAMLDMLTDRCATMCLLATLCIFYPSATILFQISMAIDISCHWIHMHTALLKGKTSHKFMDSSSHPMLKLYYTNRQVLFCMCAGNEMFYVSLYLLHFASGFFYYVILLLAIVMAPVAIVKLGKILLIFIVFFVDMSTQNENRTNTQRDGKALSVFQVVRFPNIGCTGTSSLNGTCYTLTECTSKGGTSSGSCAGGFGVCCTFTLSCGGTIAENCTYFQSSSSSQPAGQCGVKICRCSNDICQLRLDFNTFVLAGPSTVTLSAAKQIAGNILYTADGVEISQATNCLTDTFSITGVPGGVPPVICGTNSGYHVYADASAACNTLDFQLGPTAIGTTIPTRQWNIKISQISCFDANRAPSGCTQYFTGTSGVINSFNNANKFELANQQQHICFRRERGYCQICFSNVAAKDFQISGPTAASIAGYTLGSKCCSYGAAGTTTMGYDCVIIPGAMTKATTKAALVPNQAFCGGNLVIADAVTTAKTICTIQTPFKFDFFSDSFTQAAALTKGFNLAFFQKTC